MKITFGSDQWIQIVDSIVNQYPIGEIISHEQLKAKLGIEEIYQSDYSTLEDLFKAKDLQQIEYMALVSQLRIDCLESHQIYLESKIGIGYSFMQPKEQQKFAYKKTRREVNKSLRQGTMIASNVRFNELSQEERQQGNEYAVKLSMMKQMVSTARR